MSLFKYKINKNVTILGDLETESTSKSNNNEF